MEKEVTIARSNKIQIEIDNCDGIQGVINKSNKLTCILNVVARCFRAIEAMTKTLKTAIEENSFSKGLHQHLQKHRIQVLCQSKKQTNLKQRYQYMN